jgi:hypothetical protein
MFIDNIDENTQFYLHTHPQILLSFPLSFLSLHTQLQGRSSHPAEDPKIQELF